MVQTQTDLESEVHEMIQLGVRQNMVMPATWIAQAVVERHSNISGLDRDFYVLCAWAHIRVSVRRVLRTYRGNPRNTEDQLRLPGHEGLQRAYLTERDKEEVIVPVDQLTEEELLQKESELRRMAVGCDTHANELKRYRIARYAEK